MSAEPVARTASTRRPMAGDAVRIHKPKTGWWACSEELLKDGSIGIINGIAGIPLSDDDARSIMFNFNAFRGPSSKYSGGPEIVEVGGGPGSIATPMRELRPTDETVEVTFWRWKDIPRAGGGEYYKLRVPVWEWHPSEE